MVKVIVPNYIKEESLADFLAVTKELVEKTNALDAGCVKYELCKSINDPLCYYMVEEWDDQESLDKHMKAQHSVDLIPKLNDFSAKPTEIILLEKVY